MLCVFFYTNDQPLHNGTRSFIYADLCVIAQQPSFVEVETTIEESLNELTQYYNSNHLCANPDKTQVTAFHLRNTETKRTVKVKWNRTDLGTNASTIRTTALALSYSVAEYAPQYGQDQHMPTNWIQYSIVHAEQ